MVKRLLNFLDASPVNFLAARNMVSELEQAGYRRFDQREESTIHVVTSDGNTL